MGRRLAVSVELHSLQGPLLGARLVRVCDVVGLYRVEHVLLVKLPGAGAGIGRPLALPLLLGRVGHRLPLHPCPRRHWLQQRSLICRHVLHFVEDVYNTATLLYQRLLMAYYRMLLALRLRRRLLLLGNARILLPVDVLRGIVLLLIHVVVVQVQLRVRAGRILVSPKQLEVLLEPPLLLLGVLDLLLDLQQIVSHIITRLYSDNFSA